LFLSLLSIVAVSAKLFFIAHRRIGFFLMLSSVFYEYAFKKYKLQRETIDAVLIPALCISWALLLGWWAGMVAGLILCGAWIYSLIIDIRMRTNNPGCQEKEWVDWVPLPNPRIVMNIKGPIWRRHKIGYLGDWPCSHIARFEIIILNPTIIWPQYPLNLSTECKSNDISIDIEGKYRNKAPRPGELVKKVLTIKAESISENPIDLVIVASVGSYELREKLRISSIFDIVENPLESVEINRWKNGAHAGFAWRGDMDLYDPATFQSVEGLESVLDLCHRYRVASTMFLSGRLSLNKEEHKKFCAKLGVDRQSDGIDAFIEFLKTNVDLKAVIDFPYESNNKFALEIGNHMYLHYGTHAAMDEGNQWKMRSWMGDGNYPWQSQDEGSLAEQRDNAIQNEKIIREKLNYQVRSWGVPGRVYDRHTAKAVEAAGIEVGSDTNASAFSNVLRLPPPHHPEGCRHLVELTKKYPGDPDNAYKVAMLKYWIGRAHRLNQTFIFMAHHHALRYQGIACLNMIEEILRHIIHDYRGDFYISTITGLGLYWERVLCPKHRWVNAKVIDGLSVEIENNGHEKLDGIPVELRFAHGKKLLLIHNIPPQSKTQVALTEKQLGAELN
jgi:hypothetical protein